MKLSHPGDFRARRLLSAARLLALLLLVLTAVGGCASRDKGFNDEFADQAGHLRNKTAGKKLGLSARSQQIESDLGVQ
ncbi:MAG TPA: hypothetical protein VHV55_13690 [Pirellulales bacterium]|nr:hypothetical protein [Pirellulales bacterium]